MVRIIEIIAAFLLGAAVADARLYLVHTQMAPPPASQPAKQAEPDFAKLRCGHYGDPPKDVQVLCDTNGVCPDGFHYVPWRKDQQDGICVEKRYTLTRGVWNYQDHTVE